METPDAHFGVSGKVPILPLIAKWGPNPVELLTGQVAKLVCSDPADLTISSKGFRYNICEVRRQIDSMPDTVQVRS